MANERSNEQITEAVRERYAAAALQAQRSQRASCCGTGSDCCSASIESLTENRDDPQTLQEVPQGAALASLGCGNPTLLADLKPGEVVLDLGSGGGIDVLLSARRVAPGGKAYGLDMTDEMLELARKNARQAQMENVEFLKGRIESIPLPDNSVDVIISNCVINLSADKDAVLGEVYRVLKPGGRFAVADVVVQGNPLPAAARDLMALWAGCIAGALTEDEYRQKLASAGFADAEVQVLRTYGWQDVPEQLRQLVPADLGLESGTRVVSAFVKASKA
ncbi:MAG: arsenite methyltransferase [Dehalococcoidales bacterium]|nr:arsenite methyltransferase [Dehalococcoidales bacterium]